MGLFSRKKEYADLVLHNGYIYVQNSEYQYEEALAVKDGKIIAVGAFEDIEGLIGPETEQIDLEDKYVYPGFIDCHRSPVKMALDGVIEPVDEDDDADDNDYDDMYLNGEDAEDEFDGETAGESFDGEAVEIIDEDEADDIYSDAQEQIQDAAETAMFEQVEEAFDQQIDKLLDGGFTTVLDLNAPNQMEEMFIDYLMGAYNEDESRIRFFGSLYVNIPVKPEALAYVAMARRTNLSEVDDSMNAEHIDIEIRNSDPDNDKHFTQGELNSMLLAVSERNFIIYLEARDETDLRMAYEGLDYVRGKGYKNTFIIASDAELSDEIRSECGSWDTAIKTWGVDPFHKTAVYGANVKTMEDRLDELTTIPAKMLGMEDLLGSIDKGKYADFVIYDQDLLELDSNVSHGALHSEIIIMNGKVVYNVEDEINDEMLDMMLGMHM